MRNFEREAIEREKTGIEVAREHFIKMLNDRKDWVNSPHYEHSKKTVLGEIDQTIEVLEMQRQSVESLCASYEKLIEKMVQSHKFEIEQRDDLIVRYEKELRDLE